jgi:hypothetical protein
MRGPVILLFYPLFGIRVPPANLFYPVNVDNQGDVERLGFAPAQNTCTLAGLQIYKISYIQYESFLRI